MVTSRNWLGQLVATCLLICWLLPSIATAQYSFGPADFLKRLDRNGNGMIDLDEMQGSASYMIQRLARDNPKINTSQPISIKALSKEMDRLRKQRSGNSSQSSSSSRISVSSSSSSTSSSTSTKKDKPLVPGFGVENELPPIPGFGEAGKVETIEVTEQDIQYSERSFRYYDRNRDGKIDTEEMSRSRSSDLKQYDKNEDGELTVKELAVRYARMRLDREKYSKSNRSSSSRSSSNSSNGTARYTFSSNPSQRGSYSFNRGSNSSSRSKSSSKASSSSTVPSDDRKSYRFLTPAERLPSGVPQWFTDRDRDGDGQVQMSEYTDLWTDSLAEEFAGFDDNGDGIITPKEVMTATDLGAVPGSGGTASSSSKSASSANPLASANPLTTAKTASSSTTSGRPIDPRTLSFFRQVLTQSDANRDGVLTKQEWSKMSKDPSAADANSDGRITVEEYARWRTKG